MVPLQLKDPLGAIREEKGISSQFQYKCAALWRVVYVSSATKRPIGAIREEKGISVRFQVSISLRYDLSC